MSSAFCLLLFIAKAGLIWAHGRLIEPVGRSTMWRVGYPVPKNYNDNGINCGGYNPPWSGKHVKCGVCGDPYNGPRDNEAGGKYATGKVVSHYIKGHVIFVKVQLTANHGGYFLFNLCPVKNSRIKATENCFSRYPLRVESTEKLQYILTNSDPGYISLPLRLPSQLTCRQCVFRWKYIAATTWGCDGKRCCSGCGPQEEFFACSDIEIRSEQIFQQTTPVIPRKCMAKWPWRNNPKATPWCIKYCNLNLCNEKVCEKSCFNGKILQPASFFSKSLENMFWDDLIEASNNSTKSDAD